MTLTQKFRFAARRGLAAGLAAMALVMGGGSVLADGTHARPPEASRIKKERPAYGGRENTLDVLEENCFFPDTAAHDKKRRNHAPIDLMTVFNKMQKDSRTGQALARGATARDLAYCEVAPFDKGAGAVYYPDIGTVKIDWSADPAYNRKVYAHETLHGIQDGRKILDSKSNWSQETWIRATLYEEAAAKVVEIMVGFEQKQKGDDEVWKEIKSAYESMVFTGPKTNDAFLAAWLEAKLDNKSDKDALEAAGAAAWGTVFERQSWREFYITGTMGHTLGEMNKGVFDRVSFAGSGKDDVLRARASGNIGPDLNFTRGVVPPARDALFRDLPELKQAFEALELERTERAYGRKSKTARDLRQRLEADKNAYLGIDWKKVHAHYEETKDYKSMDLIMDEILEAQEAASKPPAQKVAPPQKKRA